MTSLAILPDDAEITVSRSQLTRMMLESHRKAGDSSEEIMCLKEIGKINGLYEKKVQNLTINIDQHIQQIESLSDEELLRMVGAGEDLLSLPEPIDAEFVEVKD